MADNHHPLNSDSPPASGGSEDGSAVKDAEALYTAGMAHYRAREWEQARACFTQVNSLVSHYRGVDALLDDIAIFIQLEQMEAERKERLADAAGSEEQPTAAAVPGPDGTGPLARIAFRAVARGSSALVLCNAKWTDTHSQVHQPLTPIDGTITVGEVELEVRIDPALTWVNPNDALTVHVTVDKVADLGGFEFTLRFDTAALEVQTVTLGPFLGSAGRTASAVGPIIDSEAATISFGATSLGAAPGPGGTGILAEIKLRVIGERSSTLTFSNVQLRDTQGRVHAPLRTVPSTVVVGVVTPELRLDPASTSVQPGDAVFVDAIAGDVLDVGGFEFALTFDPGVLQVEAVTLGEFLGSTGRTVSAMGPTIDNAAGSLAFGAVSLPAGEPAPITPVTRRWPAWAPYLAALAMLLVGMMVVPPFRRRLLALVQSLSTGRQLQILMVRGQACLVTEDYPCAEENFRGALALGPQNEGAKTQLAKALIGQAQTSIVACSCDVALGKLNEIAALDRSTGETSDMLAFCEGFLESEGYGQQGEWAAAFDVLDELPARTSTATGDGRSCLCSAYSAWGATVVISARESTELLGQALHAFDGALSACPQDPEQLGEQQLADLHHLCWLSLQALERLSPEARQQLIEPHSNLQAVASCRDWEAELRRRGLFATLYPPTATPSPTPTFTPTLTPTATFTSTPTPSPTPVPSPTWTATATGTPSPPPKPPRDTPTPGKTVTR
jgi:tetratricopeptide (TPR) repeat protein